jgi:hypothetical protein
MKHILLAVALAFLVAPLIATPVFAQAPRGGDRVCTSGSLVLNSDEVVDSVILFGCGARISSGAHVRKDIASFGGQVIAEQGARIDGDVVIFGTGLRFSSSRSDSTGTDGAVLKDVGANHIASTVGGDVAVIIGDLVLESTADIGRNVTVVSGAIERKEGAIVRGRLVREPSSIRPPVAPLSPNLDAASSIGSMIGSLISGFLFTVGLAAIGMFMVSVWPQQTNQVSQVARDSALPSLGVGCLTIVVALTMGIGLIVTLCGIPIAALVFLALSLAWLVGWIALGEFTGSKVLEPLHVRDSLKTPIAAVVVGVVLLALIGLVPIIGWFVTTVAATIGIGAVVLTRFGTRSYPASPSGLAPTSLVSIDTSKS